MEAIIHSLQNLQLTTKQEGGLDAPKRAPTKKITNICLQLYHENVALKKEIHRLHRLRNIPESQIPTWIH